MIVFCNTTPFVALASIGRLERLPQLFGKIHVAQSVADECAEGGRIRVPDLQSFDWIVCVPAKTTSTLPALCELDRGFGPRQNPKETLNKSDFSTSRRRPGSTHPTKSMSCEAHAPPLRQGNELFKVSVMLLIRRFRAAREPFSHTD